MKKSVRVLKILSMMLASILMFGVILCYFLIEPSVKINGFEVLSDTKLRNVQSKITILDAAGKSVTSQMTNRIFVEYDSLPSHTIDAFVAIEDARFFQHGGVDFYRIGGSTIKNLRFGDYKEGASTITQQLVKNTHLSGEKKMKRKLNEARIAIDIERHYSKNEIIKMYLNVINFGNNLYGIGAAANAYFNKSVSELSLNESALLAAIINNPSRYNPVNNPEKSNKRRKLVLSRMKKYNKISVKEYNSCIDCDIYVKNVVFEQYANYVLSECCKTLGISRSEFLTHGYTVKTYLNNNIQSKINTLVKNYTFNERILTDLNSHGNYIKDNAYIQAIVMTSTGRIVANASNTNHDLSSVYRQPGSVIKPAIAYAPAFEKKLITPLTPILDEPIDYDKYRPQNFNNKNLGWISINEALKLSQNVPAVKLMDICGIEYSKKVANRLGYEFSSRDNHLALALGGMSKGAKLTQIANSYQAFSCGGRFVGCGHVAEIMDEKSNIIYSRSESGHQAVSEETAYFINKILTECATDGTARRISNTSVKSVADKTAVNFIPTSFVAAKTGTVGDKNGNTDAFVVAYNNDFVVAVWIGAKSGTLPNTVNGSTHPCIIAKKILDFLPSEKALDCNFYDKIKHAVKPSGLANLTKFTKPNGIITIDIDKDDYKNNHKIVAADDSAFMKDKISGEFFASKPPAKKTSANQFILQMNDIDIENFVIID